MRLSHYIFNFLPFAIHREQFQCYAFLTLIKDSVLIIIICSYTLNLCLTGNTTSSFEWRFNYHNWGSIDVFNGPKSKIARNGSRFINPAMPSHCSAYIHSHEYISTVLTSTFPPFSRLPAWEEWIKSAGCLATQPVPTHLIKHFYPIRTQDFHKFARFSGAFAIKHRTRGGNAPWKYSAVTSRGCIMHGRFAEFWRILFFCDKEAASFAFRCDTVRLSESKGSLMLLMNSVLSSWEKNERSSRLRAVGRSETFGESV